MAAAVAKKQRVDEDSKPCKCQKARDQHNQQGGIAVIELVENRITEAEKAGLYRRCRLAICASKREGFGHTILEAAAYGCQVVTTDGMPMKSILRRQVGLAKPSKGASWNLGINYEVKAADIVAVPRALLREATSPPASASKWIVLPTSAAILTTLSAAFYRRGDWRFSRRAAAMLRTDLLRVRGALCHTIRCRG